MKILFIHNVGVWGGSVRSLYETIQVLSKEPKVKEIHLIIVKGSGAERFKDIAHLHVFSSVPKYDSTEFGQYRGFRKLILLREFYSRLIFLFTFKNFSKRNKDFDIIHFNEIVSFNALVKIVKSKHPSAKIVCHVRSLQKKLKESSFILKQLVSSSDALITIDDCVRQTLHPMIFSKSYIVPNIYSFKEEKRPAYSKDKEQLRILYLGGLRWEKGPDYALELAKRCKDEEINVSFTLAGIIAPQLSLFQKLLNFSLELLQIKRSLKREEVRSIINSNGLDSIVSLEGFQPNISLLFANHDVLIFPSRLNAPGRPSIEAMSYGLPSIIFTNFGSNLVVKEGITGYNIPDENLNEMFKKIEILLKHPEKLKELQQNCREYFTELFTAAPHRKEILRIYNKLLNSN